MNDFMRPESLVTFAGLVAAVAIIAQLTKSLVKKQFDDYVVRIYAFVVALVLAFIFAPTGQRISGYCTYDSQCNYNNICCYGRI